MAETIPCPEGFEPVICTGCDGVAFYVQITHDPMKLLRDVPKVWPSGEPATGFELMQCGTCHEQPRPFTSIKRDTDGRRCLWGVPPTMVI